MESLRVYGEQILVARIERGSEAPYDRDALRLRKGLA